MTATNRPENRSREALRPVTFEASVSRYAEGSCLVKFGGTHVLCTASVDENVPRWMRGSGKGWVTAEYGMLPRATHTRNSREATLCKPMAARARHRLRALGWRSHKLAQG